MVEEISVNLIPTKNKLIENYWFISPGTLSFSMYQKCLIEISTISYDIDELEFIFYISITNFIKQLELFSFDFTPVMVHIIKQQLSFFKIFCLKQKYSGFFLSSVYIDQLTKVFESLMELKRWRFVEQQICMDEIERICNFFKSRLSVWFQSNQLKAYLWRWGFKETINTIIYYSFLIPKVKNIIDVMVNNGSQYLEKMELRCQCSISLNFNPGLHMYEYEYFVMEVVFDVYRGRPLGFLDMLKYLMKSINLTQYFVKNLRTILIKDSSKFIFISNTPLRTLRLIGRNLERGESIEPFYNKIDCTKNFYSTYILHRSQSVNLPTQIDSPDSSFTGQKINWTTEIEAVNYWKARINETFFGDFKCEMTKINQSFHYWEEIYQKLISRSVLENEYNVNEHISEFNDLITKCQQELDGQQALVRNDMNSELKREIAKHKLPNYIEFTKADNTLEPLYEKLSISTTSTDIVSPTVTNMRYLMRKQTGLRGNKRISRKISSSSSSIRGNLLTQQAIINLHRSSNIQRDSKRAKRVSRFSISIDQAVRSGSVNRKMIELKDSNSDQNLDSSMINKVWLPLRININQKSAQHKKNWLKILKLDYDWDKLCEDLNKTDDELHEWCPIEYYNNFKANNPIPSQMKNMPFISIFLTLQILTNKTIVYNSHFRELNKGKSIIIPIIIKVNTTSIKPTFLGYINCEQELSNIAELRLLICQVAFDSFLLSLCQNKFLKAIFSSHVKRFDSVIDLQPIHIVSQIMGILNLKNILIELVRSVNQTESMNTSNSKKFVEILNELVFLHEFLFHRKCCSWMEQKYYGIRIIYHSLFIDGNYKGIEPFLRLPGDRRIRTIENRCNSIIAMRETSNTVLHKKCYQIEIFYDLFAGNHFSCIELIGSMLNKYYGSSTQLKAHRTLICYPSGELWVFPDIEWLKSIGNYI